MATATETRIYECMFLISQGEAANLHAVVEHIGEILGKGGAEILALKKWDERRLAYEIEKQKRLRKKTQTLDRLCSFPGSLPTFLALQLIKRH